jgi:uncharacterized protein (DUF2342 family)
VLTVVSAAAVHSHAVLCGLRCVRANSIVAIVQDMTEFCRMKQEELQQEAATAQLNATLSAVRAHITTAADFTLLLSTASTPVFNIAHCCELVCCSMNCTLYYCVRRCSRIMLHACVKIVLH